MMTAHKGEFPFIVFIIPFLAGIFCGLNLAPYTDLTVLVAFFAVCCAVFISLNLFYKRFGIYKFRWLGGALIHLIIFIAGWICVTNYNELNAGNHFSKAQNKMLLLTINSEPATRNGVTRFTGKVEQTIAVSGTKNSKTATGNLLVSIKDSDAQKLYYGDQVLVHSTYKPVEPPANPAEFNYKQYLADQNIHFGVFAYPGQYVLLKHDNGNPLIAYALKTRQHLIDELRENIHDPEALAVASTLILGYKADLSDDVLQAYSKTGTIHVLSVSGAHVAILYVLLELVFGFLTRFKYGRPVKTTLIVLIIWYYAMLSGFSPAVCRAAFMISMVIIGKTYSRAISTLNILAVSAFFLLLYDPLFITDVGFQLSYLSVAGLIILQPIVYRWFKFKNKWADRLWALCSVSIAAQVITFPLSAFYFHQFPVYFLVSNLFIIIPTAVIMYTGLAYFVLAWIPIVGKLLGFILEKTILIMDSGLACIEHTPFAGINKIWLTTFEYLLLYAVIIALFYYSYNRKFWLLRFGLLCALALSISLSLKKWHKANSNEMVFLALRKHTGIVFRSGDKAAVLTDLADTDKAYRYSVQPYLDSCQVSKVYRVSPDSSINKDFILKKGNLAQFDNKTMLMDDKTLQYKSLPERLKIDYLLANPASPLAALDQNIDYSLLIIDSRRDTLTAPFKREAVLKHKNFVFWGSNKSIKLVSN